MPAPRTKAGLPERNRVVGADWSGLSTPRKNLFHPPLFRRLASAVIPNPPPIPPPEQEDDPRNPADITALVPDFREMVDVAKITRDVSAKCLGQKTADHEKKGRVEIAQMVRQVRDVSHLTPMTVLGNLCFHILKLETVFSIFHIHFHLLVATFNPKTTMKNALWMNEYTSCKAWGDHAKSELHLLEAFARHATSVPASVKSSKIQSKPTSNLNDTGRSKPTQQEDRKLLNDLLNGLVRKHPCYSFGWNRCSRQYYN